MATDHGIALCTGELARLRQRAEAVGPEADPLIVMQDRQLEPVLLELLTAIRKARAQALEQRHTAKERLGRMVGDLTRATAWADYAPEFLASGCYPLCLMATDTAPQKVNEARLDQSI